MQPERLTAILNKVQEKYVGRRLNREVVHEIYNDFSAVIKGLHKSEHFLNVSIDHRTKVMLVKDEETMTYLGLLPYLDNRLMNTNEVYLIYLLKDEVAYTQCAVTYKDLYNGSEVESYIGFDLQVAPIIPIGVYYPDTDEFRRWRKE